MKPQYIDEIVYFRNVEVSGMVVVQQIFAKELDIISWIENVVQIFVAYVDFGLFVDFGNQIINVEKDY